MRPHRLRMENFGAYRAPTLVDFDALGPLFLVWGKTGSGKTTLFDAMTYALYGAVSGSRRRLDRDLVSHYAKPGEKPLVEFEFSLGGVDWKVLRSPPWKRQGRGGKEVEIPPEALLSRREGGAWLPVADKKSEVDEAVAEALGLSLDEFSKIVLLPQGEFQRFLEMDSGERVEILEKLFPVDLHGAVTQIARERTRQAQVELARIEAEIERQGALGGAALAAEGLQALEASVGDLESLRDGAHEAAVAAEADLRRGGEDLARHRRAAEARAALDHLEAQAGPAQERQKRITLARKARPLLPLLEAEAGAALGLAAEEAGLADRGARLALLEKGRVRAEEDRAKAARAQAQVAELDGQAGELRKAQEAWTTAIAARLARDGAAEAARTCEARLAQCRALEEASLELVRDTAIGSEEEEALGLARETALARLELARGLETLVLDLEACLARSTQAAQAEERSALALGKARGALEEHEQSLLQEESSRLALALHEGQACPVCGSLDHPAPARARLHGAEPSEGPRLRAALEGAIAAQAAAAQASDSAKAALELSRLRLDEVRPGSDYPDPAAVKAQRVAAEAEAGEAATRLEALANRRRARDAALVALEQARKAREGAGVTASKAGQDLAACEANLRAVEGQMGEGDPGPALKALAEQRAALATAGALALEAAESWTRELRAAEARLQESKERLPVLGEAVEKCRRATQEALAEADFGSPQDARLAALPPRELAVLEAEDLAFERAYTQAKAASEEAQRARGQGEAPDLAALETARDRAQEAYRGAQAAWESAREILGSRRRQADALESLGSERRELQERTARLLALSTLLSGDLSGRRLPFKSFVLSLYFREVVARASLRLSEMSEGRYGLAMDEAASSGRGRTGLDLLVLDSQTGRPRPTGTLSGGERFLTALALALALADTIRSRSGGVNLDAVFIDEGFGSLDEEALDRAVAALDRARGARLIGIVSHVQELRVRIPSRIEVTKGRGGSRLEIV